MSNNRKTQSEIDKLLKKIDEGIDEYDSLYEKFTDAANQPLKERFEGDLKKEIKKLQRHREQVKGLIQNPEVKDKKALEVARRRVEEKMEAFKVVERETKTKTFSKEGLAKAESNETPQARTESWIKVAISDLKEQLETTEFELQADGGSGGGSSKKRGGKKGGDDPREARLIRLKFNIVKLEQLLRAVVNEDISPDEVDEIEDDVQKYIEDNAEEDFEEDEDLYERFDLPDVAFVNRQDDDTYDSEEERNRKPPPKATPKAAPAAAPAKDTPPTVAAKTPATPAAVKSAPPPAAAPAKKAVDPAPVAAQSVPNPAPTTPATPVTPYAKKAAAAVQQSPAVPPAQKAPVEAAAKTPQSNVTAAPPVVAPAKTFAAAASAAANKSQQPPAPSIPSTPPQATPPQQPQDKPKDEKRFLPPPQQLFGNSSSREQDMLLEEGDALLDDDMDMANDDTFGDDVMPASTGSLADMAAKTSDWERAAPPPSLQRPSATSGLGQQQAQKASSSTTAAPQTPVAAPQPPIPAASSPQQTAGGNPQTTAVWSALLKGQQPSEEKVAMHRMLDMSLDNLPHPHDVERIRPFVPPNPYQTKPHHPQQVHPGFSTSELFRKFDPDTLFFIFYYQQQTYQQYLAAKELKRQSFRYHKKFKTWFQRHDKPKESTEEYESGAYLYFDYENGWCQRIKNDFVFKYTYLEDELV